MGYAAGLLIGISMGLIGGGGSILTIPILVYLFYVSPTLAISYSLFIVGITSLIGAFMNYRKGLVNFKTALLFGASSITTVFLSRKFIIPNLPEVFFQHWQFPGNAFLICNGGFCAVDAGRVLIHDKK